MLKSEKPAQSVGLRLEVKHPPNEYRIEDSNLDDEVAVRDNDEVTATNLMAKKR